MKLLKNRNFKKYFKNPHWIKLSKDYIKDDIKKGEKGYKKQRLLRVVHLVYYHFMQRNISQFASALAFDLLLAMIPTFFLAFSFLSLFNAFEGGNEGAIRYIQENIIPLPTENFESFFEILKTQNYGTIGGFGVITLLIFSTNLFIKIENVFNQVWRVPDKRPFIRRFTNFFTFLVLAPLLFSLSLKFSSQFKQILTDLTFAGSFIALLNYILSGFFIVVMFMFMFSTLPNTRVNWKAALWGGLISSFSIIVLKSIFSFYVNSIAIDNYKNIFGTLAVIPLFFVWIYLSWVVTLIGAITAYVTQKINSIWENDKKFILKDNQKEVEIITPEKLIEIFYIIAYKFYKGEGHTPLGEINHYFKIDPDNLSYILDKWEENNLLIRAEESYIFYFPKKPLKQIELTDIVQPFVDNVEIDIASSKFKQFIGTFRSLQSTFIENKTVEELIEDDLNFKHIKKFN